MCCWFDGLAEPMFLSSLSMSAPEYGGRCSYDVLAEPMILCVFRCESPSMGGALFKRQAHRANESHPSGVSFRVCIGSRYLHGGIFCRHQLPSLCRVALFARRARRADESHMSSVSYRAFIGSRYS